MIFNSAVHDTTFFDGYCAGRFAYFDQEQPIELVRIWTIAFGEAVGLC